jgi:hypothetical protein
MCHQSHWQSISQSSLLTQLFRGATERSKIPRLLRLRSIVVGASYLSYGTFKPQVSDHRSAHSEARGRSERIVLQPLPNPMVNQRPSLPTAWDRAQPSLIRESVRQPKRISIRRSGKGSSYGTSSDRDRSIFGKRFAGVMAGVSFWGLFR